MSLASGDFQYISTLLREKSGIVIEPGKEYLVETRLRPIVKRTGSASLTEFIAQLRRRPVDGLHMTVVEALMTNETQFFRDGHPFDAIRTKVLPELILKRQLMRQLNVWCAAASTGQEPYSLAMLLAEYFPQLSYWNVKCLASDISHEVLDRARHGSYRQLELDRGLPLSLRDKYFQQQGNQWQIDVSIRSRVDFQNINLILPWPSMPMMDIILMRNVLIYFATETKREILAKVRKVLKPDGYLFLGSAETTVNLDPAFKQVPLENTVCFQLRG